MSTTPGFWRRQFLLPPTRAQTVWDLLMGCALPLGCLAVERILFGRMSFPFRGSLFGPFQVFSTGFILTEVLILGLWLVLRRKLGRSAGYFAGPLLAGWFFALALGLLLLPASALGLFVVIGLFGFSPWLTAFTFLRNWKLACTLSRSAGGVRRLWLGVAGIIFALTPALALHARAGYLVRRLIESPHSTGRIEQARHFPLFPVQELADAWDREEDPDRRAALSEAHYALTGSRIQPLR